TTPFLLLAASLFFRSSPRLYHWLLNHKFLGPYIRLFREHKAIPLRGKVVSVSLVWITLSYCALTISSLYYVKALFIALAIGVTWYICSYKTLRKEDM
ncbi:MAG: YbaN family protein, partial [Phocaeicola sp.]